MTEKSPFDRHSNEPVRQVELGKGTPLTEEGHMEELYVPGNLHQVIMKQSKAVCRAINQLLNSFQFVFSKDECDLGSTHLVEQHISTGDA